jgi:hypothetical protein
MKKCASCQTYKPLNILQEKMENTHIAKNVVPKRINQANVSKNTEKSGIPITRKK